MKTMVSYNYFLGIQHSFFQSWAVEANYVGSQGRNTYMNFDVNRYAGDLFDGRLDRLNTSFADIQYGQARGSSYYNGGNVSVKKRYSVGPGHAVGVHVRQSDRLFEYVRPRACRSWTPTI